MSRSRRQKNSRAIAKRADPGEWQPTELQAKFVDAFLAEPSEKRQVERAAEAAGCSARAAYKWFRSPAFRAHINQEATRTYLPRFTVSAWRMLINELNEGDNTKLKEKAVDMLRLMLGLHERGPITTIVQADDEASRLALGAGLDRIRQLMHQDQAAGGRVPADAEFVEEAEDDRGIDELHGHYGQESQPEGKYADCDSPIPREATAEQAADREPFNQQDENNGGNEQPDSSGPHQTDEDPETRDRATRADV